jgi:hypothetical protein
MAEEILEGSLDHEALGTRKYARFVDQLKKHPLIESIINPIVTVDDFKASFKCVPEKTASSPSGRGGHHYKACKEGSADSLSDILSQVYAATMTVPLKAGYCPDCWKQVIDVVLNNILGVVRSEKLQLIQLLEADLNQVLHIAFTRDITKLSKQHMGIVSEHEHGRSYQT